MYKYIKNNDIFYKIVTREGKKAVRTAASREVL